MRVCIKCGKEKEENSDNFRFDKSSQKYRNVCIECIKKQKTEYNKANKLVIAVYNKNYHQDNRDELNAGHKKYYQGNKDTLRKQQKEYLENNRENTKITKKRYQKIKRAADPTFKLRGVVSTMVGKALHAIGKSKNGSSITDYLPYTIQELKNYLEKQFEPWMTWDNHGIYDPKIWNDDDPLTWTWNIDHIIPQSKIPYTSMEDVGFKKCWALDNLRPLSSKKNIEKGNR